MDLTKDLAFAIRSLRRAPAFTTAAIATLALGVGAALAVFNVVNGVLLRPLPYSDPARIQMIWITDRNDAGDVWDLPLTSGFYTDIERQARGFEAMAAFRAWNYALSTPGSSDAEPLAGARVSPALFTVLGIRPQLGQPFATSDAIPGAPNVALISHDLWQRRFGADRTIVGQRVTLNGQAFTVTGVMPRGFGVGASRVAASSNGDRLREQRPNRPWMRSKKLSDLAPRKPCAQQSAGCGERMFVLHHSRLARRMAVATSSI